MKKITVIFLLISGFCFGQIRSTQMDVSKILYDKKATVAVSVLGFEKEYSFDKNGDAKLPLLSVFKFHIAATVLHLVDEGELALDQKVILTDAEMIPDTWSPIREKFPKGDVELTLAELLEYTVAQSDNNGCDKLLKLIGGTETVQKFMDSKGVKDFQIKVNEEAMQQDRKNMYENFSSTKSAVRLLKSFYENKIISRKSTEFLMNTMLSTSTGANKLKGWLPKNVRVAHKTGSSGKDNEGLTIAENDMGIVTLPNGKHYAIAVLISDSTETAEVNCGIIADISKVFYDLLSK
ncbi:class A beta-lactamase [Chryseobacterium sp. Leaf180]|uniref:class A beta-lactamase, subclass A2 n=1 Tax=Chryseobacterium sp. Leaf180 TaxID=1736289 RepID=UPI0006F26104|nr:class A beta-lactamase, subclass A2 [Chryseobacterium sp. Leaf180]KQR91481.1 class A beta-lactamase [Chryseobacterium sp. Leaf180]